MTRFQFNPFQFLIGISLLWFYSVEVCSQTFSPAFGKYVFQLRKPGLSVLPVQYDLQDPADIPERIRQELSVWQNTGYPFARIRIDSLDYTRQWRISAFLEPGPQILNGELVIHGDSALKQKVVRNWIRFRKGAPFSSDLFSQVPFLSSHIPFAEETQVPQIEWFGNQAIIHVFLVRRRTNSFTGILGVLPQPDGKRVMVTGNLDANLVNLFGWGMALNFRWTRFAPSSQTAQLALSAPALNASGLGIEAEADLFRQDSILNRQRVSVTGISSGQRLWQLRFGVSAGSASGKFSPVPGQSLFRVSTRSIHFGVRFDPVPPGKVMLQRTRFSFLAAPSIKKLEKEEGITSIPQVEIQSSGSIPLWSVGSRFCVQSHWDLAWLWAREITLPDQFRMGGNQSVRGFNENNFFTSQHVQVTLQPQFLLEKNFLAGFFTDCLLFNPSFGTDPVSDTKLAVGIGFFSELEAGRNLVRISIANGFSRDIPFDYQTTKIHFGYVARF